MKLTYVLMVTAFLQVSLAGNAQRLTLSAKAMPLAQVLEHIQEQTGYHFLVTDQMLAETNNVTAKFKNKPLDNVLKECFANQPLGYEIKENLIVIYRKPVVEKTQAADVKITGVVTDDTNQPLPGVTIKLQGTTTSTQSNVDGKFTINVPDGKGNLLFSFIGFVTQEVQILGGRTVYNVQMHTQLKSLSEVVVIGYGQQRKADVTSAVATVKADNFVTGPVTDAAELLKGKVAGLNITNPSGDPTAQSQIQLRGTNTINGANTGVLVIIDGVPGDLLTVAPEDIAEISVLKDGSSAAIYGVRGSNGVIIITTKSGKGVVNAHVDYSGNVSIGQITRRPKLLTAQDYRDQIKAGLRDPSYDKGTSTDWLDAITKRAPVSTVQNASFSGGNSQTNYTASFNYRFLNGMFLQSNHAQLTGRADINHSMFDGKLKFNLGMIQTNFNSLNFSYYDYRQAMRMNPTAPVKMPDGTYYQEPNNFEYQNPVSDAYTNDAPNSAYNSRYNATISFLPIEGLRLAATGSYTKSGYQNLSYQNHQNISTLRDNQNGVANIYQGQGINRFLNLSAEYARSFGDHRFSVLTGYEYQDNDNFGTTISNHGFPTDIFGYNQIQLGTAQKTGQDYINSGRSQSNLISYFARGTYNYKEKYLLLASLRIDGASQLYGASKPYGKFPSVQAGWRITKEAFMKDQQLFDDLKLRAGYGVTGNQPSAGFLAVGLLGYGNYILYNGQWIQTISPSQNANPALRWEEKHETNLGLDFSMLKNRISGTIDLYNRRITGLLYNYQVPSPPNLYPTTQANVGTMNNKGLEVAINFVPVKKRDFSWTSTVTFSTNTNKLISLSNDLYQATLPYFTAGSTGPPATTFTHIVQVGQNIGDFYAFKVVGITNDGYWLYQEPNGTVVPYSQFKHAFEDKQVVGNGLPKYYAGWNNTLNYKNWDFSVTMRGAFRFQIANLQRADFELPGIMNYNRMASAYDKIYGVAVLNKNVAQEFNSYYIENGDFWKIDNINIGYTFRNLRSKYIHNPRIAFSTLNTFIITKYKGNDPEVDVSGLTPGVDARDVYPSQRIYNLSVSATF
ncbi:SusC/RagA family TonB-linked outer membrane protein [Mucilaginibacter sp. KACC 22063]|uniref:SusC/RagA family TonB-linked outer membrane protein n=1 Tax=Mucilaginibacter sp. KACC 22063 TaxID=3025666 RepID=UPI002366A4CD|nr:SusC/RagA family TonB-linked outer membrane protein [Mucilaginibacter sp. KACC 22063]WDF57274.1 SusC/RagA family TonB-linked outer membrane protein [Mucilaginibacter sp. KACC 22063]